MTVGAWLRLLEAVVAVGLICFGVSMWSIPAAFVVGGVLVLADRLT